ncbi:hypothetical protein [Acetivibrio ethanolgignens]|uniref:Histidine kinase N-terminal 7TM region domain-containing protein n=1 Tax=Acetivibrio ethanolgignens TaxID=290052 RepID=A0A0V8QBU2_9FIRM|nr:hypothetical protein [Acetivibrio ethanolgignens]KSV57962.1 hypothetical protein ASU35_14545 [Acetivibrio ethanolgignens]
MQAVFETLFDVIYLVTVISMGLYMILKAKEKQYRMFGFMAVILGFGDAFHLVPRAYAFCTDGLANHTTALGTGKFITSITMTIFYLVLYHIFRERYQIQGRPLLTVSCYALAVLRIILCFMPQNRWTSTDAPLSWGIYRNIPFALLGLIIIVIFYQEARRHKDKAFRFMWLAIVLSFGFYIPVVLFADTIPMLGMLMIPKTCAYVWVVYMGFAEMKRK